MAMSAMEKMVANMLGFTPEQMHEMISGFSTLATTLKAQLDSVEKAQAEILHHVQEAREFQNEINSRLEGLENAARDRNNASGGRSGRGRGRNDGGSGDAPRGDVAGGDAE